MKKGWKIFWVMCISLGILGIALCISGVILGATAASVRDAFGIWYASGDLDPDDDLPLRHGSAYDSSTSGYEHDTDEGHHTDEGYRTDASISYFSGIHELEVDVTCLCVDITKGTGDEIVVDASDVEQDARNDLVINTDDGELEIELKNRKAWDKLGNNNYSSKGTLLIEIPENVRFDEASVKVGAGELIADWICAQKLDIEVGAGKVSLDSFTADKFEMECGAGEAIVYGDAAAREAKIECGIGSVTYYAVGNQEDYDYEVKCGIGSVNVGGDFFSGLSGERRINNGRDKKIEIECGIGTVDVEFYD